MLRFWVTSLFIIFHLCGSAQIKIFNYSFENEKLSRVLKEIKKDSGYRLAFNNDDIKGQRVTAFLKNKELKEVLNEVLPADLDFNLQDNLIIIFKIEQVGNSATGGQPPHSNFEFSGVIKDFFSGEVLPYATVTLRGFDLTFSSNQQGEFHIQNYPVDTIPMVLTYVGYRKKILFPNQFENKFDVQITLKPEATFINGVVIESFETTPLLSNRSVSEFDLDVLRLPQVTNFGETDALALVRALPGFDPSSESNLALSSRGLRSDENLYALDGFSVLNPSHFFGLFSSINSLSVKNIKVQKGAYSSSIGGRSSAAIHISSYDGNEKRIKAKIKTGLISTSLRLDGPIRKEKVHFSFTVRKSHVGLYGSELYEQLYNSIYNSNISLAGSTEELDAFSSEIDPKLDFTDLQSKLSVKLSKKTNLNINGYYSLDFSDQFIRDSLNTGELTINYRNQYEWFSKGASLDLFTRMSSKLSVRNLLSFSSFNSGSSSDESYTGLNSSNIFSLQSSFSNQVSDLSASSQWVYTYSDSLRINFGTELNRYQIKEEESSFGQVFNLENDDALVTSFYFQLSKKFKRLNLDMGSRLMVSGNDSRILLEPRMNLSYKVSSNSYLKLGYGRHSQILRKTRDLNFFRGTVFHWDLASDSDVPISIVDQIILGTNIHLKGITLDVEAFYLRQNGSSEDRTSLLSLANQNVEDIIFGRTRSSGFESSLVYNYKRNKYSLSHSYIHSNGVYSIDGELAEFKNSSVSRNSVNFLWLWESDHWRFSLNKILSEGKPYTPVIGSYEVEIVNGSQRPFLVFGGYNSQLLPIYGRTDLAASFRAQLGSFSSIEIGASVHNILNKQNLKFYRYSIIDNEQTENFSILQREVNHLPRLFSLFLTLDI